MNVLVTGAAGFIGSRLMLEMARRGDEVVGVDNINDYYDPRLKYARLEECGFSTADTCREQHMAQSATYANCRFVRMGIDDREHLDDLFRSHSFTTVVNLAAQAGVRYSIENPYAYMQSNMLGFLNILECCRNHGLPRLVYASSSSVYGENSKVPFSEDDRTDTPVSLYAASKKADELMAYSYSRLYGLRCTGLRFFTVYGPWGRPDMAPMLFADAISHGREIKVFNNGCMMRDFTYIDDIVDGTMRVLDMTPADDYSIYNIGCSQPVRLTDFISELEQALGTTARRKMMPMQPGDVSRTYADTSKLQRAVGYKPRFGLHDGIRRFAEWYRSDKNPLRDAAL